MFKQKFLPLTLLVVLLFLALGCRTFDTLAHLGAVPTTTRTRPPRTPTPRVTHAPLKTPALQTTTTATRTVTELAKTPTNLPATPTKAPLKHPTAAATHAPAASPTRDPLNDSSP